MNLPFSEMTTKQKKEPCLAIFELVLLMENFILLIAGENYFSLCGVLLNLVENLSNEQMLVEKIMKEFVKLRDDKVLDDELLQLFEGDRNLKKTEKDNFFLVK